MEQVEKQLTITCKRALAKKVLRGLLFNIYLCEKIYLSRPLMDPTMSLESKIERIADWLEKPTQCWNPLEYSLTQSLSTQKQNILMFKMMQKMIQDIATCNQQPKKPTRSSRTLSAFTIFAELPFDLREHIWVNTLPGSRTVEVYRDYYRTKSLDIGKAGHQELSTIRQACKESNDIILSRYHRILTSTFRTSSQSGEPNVLFNPSRDKLFLNRILFEELPHRKPYYFPDIFKDDSACWDIIQEITFSLSSFMRLMATDQGPSDTLKCTWLPALHRLKRINIIVNYVFQDRVEEFAYHGTPIRMRNPGGIDKLLDTYSLGDPEHHWARSLKKYPEMAQLQYVELVFVHQQRTTAPKKLSTEFEAVWTADENLDRIYRCCEKILPWPEH